MSSTTIPIGNPGRAESKRESFTQYDAILSDTPTMFTVDMKVAASQTLSLYQVVGVDSSGNVIPAVKGTTAAIGVMAGSVTSASGTTPSAQVYRGGHFNMDALVWHSSYATDADKEGAFLGAQTPTQIVIGFNKYHRKP